MTKPTMRCDVCQQPATHICRASETLAVYFCERHGHEHEAAHVCHGQLATICEVTSSGRSDVSASAQGERALALLQADLAASRRREQQIREAAEAAVAFLDTIQWTEATTEHDGVNVQHALEVALALSGEPQEPT